MADASTTNTAVQDLNTIQTYLKQHTNDKLNKYALFLGGLNVTKPVLQCYDPLRTGYGRLFMVRKPVFLNKTIPNKLKKFKHILEYGNTSVQGINDVTVNFNSITGGYAGKSFEIPSVATDDTNEFSVTVYEFSGSPVRDVIHSWINGTTDLLTGLSHYNGVKELPRIQANQTAEFIYVETDNTGEGLEYACMFANCFPKNLKNDHFNYTAGEHGLVEYTINFTCTKYESMQINMVARELLKRYTLLANSLNFYSGLTPHLLGKPRYYDFSTGKQKVGEEGMDVNTLAPMNNTDMDTAYNYPGSTSETDEKGRPKGWYTNLKVTNPYESVSETSGTGGAQEVPGNGGEIVI